MNLLLFIFWGGSVFLAIHYLHKDVDYLLSHIRLRKGIFMGSF